TQVEKRPILSSRHKRRPQPGITARVRPQTAGRAVSSLLRFPIYEAARQGRDDWADRRGLSYPRGPLLDVPARPGRPPGGFAALAAGFTAAIAAATERRAHATSAAASSSTSAGVS